jgi:hypothetical protein
MRGIHGRYVCEVSMVCIGMYARYAWRYVCAVCMGGMYVLYICMCGLLLDAPVAGMCGSRYVRTHRQMSVRYLSVSA